jgi:hypothetical protein
MLPKRRISSNLPDMPTTKHAASLNDFLAVLQGSKEVGLALAEDNADRSRLANALEEQGLKRSARVLDLFTAPQTYIVLGKDADKDLYDFAVQYPTGQVEIFDTKRMRSEILLSTDGDRRVVFLAAKDDLDAWQAKGFDILSAVGPTYRA